MQDAITNEATVNSEFSFQLGWGQLAQSDVKAAKAQIMAALGIKSRSHFLRRLKGTVEPKVSEKESINRVFEKFGITKVWGQ